MTNGAFANDLRDLMRSWHWPEHVIDKALPDVIETCVRVGILTPTSHGFAFTELVEDDGAWDKVLAMLREKGVGVGGPAS